MFFIVYEIKIYFFKNIFMIFELCINIQVVPVIKKVRRFPGNEIEQRHNSGQGENSKWSHMWEIKVDFCILKCVS